jgi:plastocyanin
MIWLSRICFSGAIALALNAGTVNGRVELRDSREPAVRKSRDFSGVVVSLWPLGGAALLPTQHAAMVQKNKMFLPHVMAVTVGSAIDFPNRDPIFHNAFSNHDGQVFDVGLYPPGSSRTVVFRRPGAVRVFCNIHSTMSAIIVVLPTPCFAVTAANGIFQIPDVPPGPYTLKVFHERATPATLQSLERRIEVPADMLATGSIVISEAGYLPMPHRNKYGREYPPEPAETAYPGK